MQIILLDKIENLGELGDKVSVKSGYARNFLIPGGKAKYATAANIAEFETMRADLEAAAATAQSAADKRFAAINEQRVTIPANAGAEGKLFGSVGTIEIAEALVAAGHEVEKKEIRLPEGPLRNTGEFEISIHLHTDLDAVIVVEVVPEEV